MGDKRSILLANHGYLVAASTIEEAAILAIYMERAARNLLMAMGAGKVNAVQPHMARTAHDFMLGKPFVGASFNYFARRVLEKTPNCIDR